MVDLIEDKFKPETEAEVCKVTGLSSRLMRPRDNVWLRCQLGMWEIGNGDAPMFHLRAFGPSWARAYEMWKERERQRAIFTLS